MGNANYKRLDKKSKACNDKWKSKPNLGLFSSNQGYNWSLQRIIINVKFSIQGNEKIIRHPNHVLESPPLVCLMSSIGHSIVVHSRLILVFISFEMNQKRVKPHLGFILPKDRSKINYICQKHLHPKQSKNWFTKPLFTALHTCGLLHGSRTKDHLLQLWFHMIPNWTL